MELQAEWIKNGGDCDAVEHVICALRDIAEKRYHLVSFFMQQENQTEILRQIAHIRGMSTVAIVAAARKSFDPALRIKALEAGVDQFYTFSKSTEERVAIARALIRRSLPAPLQTPGLV